MTMIPSRNRLFPGPAMLTALAVLTVVGCEDHAPLLLEPASLEAAAHGAHWTPTALPVPEGFLFARARAISPSGMIVGTANALDDPAFSIENRAIAWDPDGHSVALLDLSPGHWASSVGAMDPAGYAAGMQRRTATGPGISVPAVWAPDGTPTLLGVPENSNGVARDLHPGGRVVGSFVETSECARAAVWDRTRPEAWTLLAPLPGHLCARLYAIGDPHTVAGHSYVVSAEAVATVWRAGVPEVLPLPPGASFASPLAMNRANTIVGLVLAPDHQAVRWEGESVEVLALPPECSGAIARGISDAGDVVGECRRPAGGPLAMLWPRTGEAPVLLMPLAGHAASSAEGFRPNGDVVGSSSVSAGMPTPVVWRRLR